MFNLLAFLMSPLYTHTHAPYHSLLGESQVLADRRPMQRQRFGARSAWDMGLHFPVIKYPKSSVMILTECPWGLGGKFLGPGRGRAFPSSSDGSAAPRAPEPHGRPWRRPHVLRCSYGEWDGGGALASCSSWNSIAVSSQLCQSHTQRRLLYLFRSAQSMALRTRDAHL